MDVAQVKARRGGQKATAVKLFRVVPNDQDNMGPRTQKGDVGKAYDSVADEWEQKILDPYGYHFWSYNVFDRVIQPYADGAQVILDIGCGTGAWLADQGERNSDRLLLGIDISNEMAKRANKKCGCPIVVADAERQPFKDDIFDLIVSRGDAIIQAYNPLEAFSEVHRILMPGGRVCFEGSWSSTPFEGLCREDDETIYRKDTIRSEGEVKFLNIERYHLPNNLQTKAEKELGDEEFYPTKWPKAKLTRATSIEKRHMLVMEKGNIQRLLRGVDLVLEDIMGTGVLGWQVSTKNLSQEIIDKITMQANTAIEKAAEMSRHTDLAESHRVTVIAQKTSETIKSQT